MVDDEGAIRLRRAIMMLSRQLNRSSTGAGLTPSQASVLGLVVARGPLTLAELGELEGLNPTMLSRVVSKLHSMGLIDRIPDPADLRSASVVSAPAGRRINQQIKARRAAAMSACMEQLSAGQAAALTKALPALEELAEIMRQPSAADQVRHPVK
jgi:DNA-binding MarR family transcriptional regulator